MKLCLECGEPCNATRCRTCQQGKDKIRNAQKKRAGYHDRAYRAISPYGTCACCGTQGKMTRDHIVPLAAGGPNTPSNIQLLCKPCNSSKADTDACKLRHDHGQ